MCAPSSSSGAGSSKRRCKLNPPEEQPQPPNEANEGRYTQNFAGKFCRCGRDYDPESESEAMINCIGCEVSGNSAVWGIWGSAEWSLPPS